MMKLEEMKYKLRGRNLAAVAAALGMHRQQLWVIANSDKSNPTHQTMKKISDYLESNP